MPEESLQRIAGVLEAPSRLGLGARIEDTPATQATGQVTEEATGPGRPREDQEPGDEGNEVLAAAASGGSGGKANWEDSQFALVVDTGVDDSGGAAVPSALDTNNGTPDLMESVWAAILWAKNHPLSPDLASKDEAGQAASRALTDASVLHQADIRLRRTIAVVMKALGTLGDPAHKRVLAEVLNDERRLFLEELRQGTIPLPASFTKKDHAENAAGAADASEATSQQPVAEAEQGAEATLTVVDELGRGLVRRVFLALQSAAISGGQVPEGQTRPAFDEWAKALRSTFLVVER